MSVSINRNLKMMSEFNPTTKSSTSTIVDLCHRISNGEIVLPVFQTSVRWNLERCVELLDFQLLGKAPVSPISFNEIKHIDIATPQVSFIHRDPISNEKLSGKLSTIDGQQRLTCNYKAFIDHDQFRSIALDLVKGKFVIVIGEFKSHQVPVGKLLNRNVDVFRDYKNKVKLLRRDDVYDLLVAIRSKFQKYSYTIHTAENLTKKEQINWFNVLNLAGTRVPIIQMKFAKLKADGVDIYVDYVDKFINKIQERGFEVFARKTTEVSYPASSLNSAYEFILNKPHSLNMSPIVSDVKVEKICKLSIAELEEAFELTLSALDTALDFIQDNQLEEPNRIEYISFLVGLFVHLKGNTLTEEQKRDLISWYNNVNFLNTTNSTRRDIFDNLLKTYCLNYQLKGIFR
ncbi:hypothetical protein [Mechercharimyces sp. CAU 1602]|uniref:hypothetical protein n=1 Tax=Mechercharimyces sp. CAU 1602 TaxID=2973933 RepID=UPI00216140EF|nr:hypothetical protein [Mechercharimyces sp. CAU 1602]MCS1351684.1 hypothetical protein [Mechercharimyces sp. CAU 1602]